MPIPVRPDLSEETLRQLLAEGHESETLDYKSSCNLSNTDELLEIVKDLAAMQVHGGYIVIGADDFGRPTDQLEAHHLRLFEQATLRAKACKYLPEPLDLRARHHHVDGHDYILVYVGENADGFAVFKAPGNNSKNQSVFRQGEVFARHGTASEAWNQYDISRIRSRLVAREKERWLTEASENFAALLPSPTINTIVSGPARALTWQLDNDTFIEVVIEQIRRHDLIPLKLLLSNIPSEVGTMLDREGEEERVAVVLDRLTCLAAVVLQLDEEEHFRSVVEALVAIYTLPIGGDGLRRRDLAVDGAKLWFMVVQRLIGIGALAERLKHWEAIRFIVLQKGRGYDFEHYPNWYRHALTMAARADLLRIEQGGQRIGSSLLRFAQVQVERLSCLRPDLPVDDEELINSICRFDLLACLVGIDDAGTPHGSAYYPNFSKYHSYRSVPAVGALLEHRVMRDALFHGSDVELAEALRELSRTAGNEGFGAWDGFDDRRVQQFLAHHEPPPGGV